MDRALLFAVAIALLPGNLCAQEDRFPARHGYTAINRLFPTAFQEDFFKEKKDDNGKEDDNGKKNGNGEDEGPKHTRDNAFLVEEAVNQEKGQVQHILNMINFFDWPASGRSRVHSFSYTMEMPLGSQRHQFSFVTGTLSSFFKDTAGLASQEGGFADTFVNYRYQLLADDDFLWCAPRFTLIVPTGDERFGTGFGQLGYQFNLPISRYGELFDFHFNAGATYVPNARILLEPGLYSPRHDRTFYNLGVSAFYKLNTKLHLFVEAVALWNEEITDRGESDHVTQALVNPGFRYVLCQLEGIEWVAGLSMPIGITAASPDIGVFGYMSVEHTFRKKKKEGNGE